MFQMFHEVSNQSKHAQKARGNNNYWLDVQSFKLKKGLL